jgi:hypothetical protein
MNFLFLEEESRDCVEVFSMAADSAVLNVLGRIEPDSPIVGTIRR